MIEKNIIRIVNSTTETKLHLNTKKCEIMTIMTKLLDLEMKIAPKRVISRSKIKTFYGNRH